MVAPPPDRTRAELEALAETHGRDRSALLPILQAVMRRHHEISDFAMQAIADILKIPAVDVYGVVTFYAFLNQRYQGKFVVRLCRTISCALQGTNAVARQLSQELGIQFGHTTPDGMFTLEYAHCLGMCDQAPALLVNDEVFVRVTPGQVSMIIDACRSNLQGSYPLRKEAVSWS